MPDVFRVSALAITATGAVNVVSFGSASTAVVRLLTLCNTHTSATASINVQVLKANNTNTPIVMFAYTQVTAQQTVMPFSEPLTLEGGDKLQVDAGQANRFHVVAAALETS